MEIIYLADIHGDFARVKELLASTDAQVYVIAGDLIDRPFFTSEMAARYRRLQSSLSRLLYRLGDQAMDMDEFAESILERTGLPRDVMADAAEYRESTIRARRVLQQKYKVLESIICLKQNSMVFCLPGNYDMDLQYTSLHGRDLHRHWYHVAELRIAGYGGADVATPGIPQRYSVPYRADRGAREMTRFFAETRPDIIVTHKPAHGIHDHVAPMGESGSTELRAYCEESRVPLCLTGHIHDQWGFQETGGTIFLNPSNFGGVPQPDGRESGGGFFYRIGTRERQIDRVVLSKLVRGRVYDLAAFTPGTDGWAREVLDPERFGALLRGKSLEGEAGPAPLISRDALVRKMRWFFPGGDGGAAHSVLDEISQALAEVERSGGVCLSVGVLGRGGPGCAIVLYYRKVGESPPAISKMNHLVKAAFEKCHAFRVVDLIDLDKVARAVQARDYECDSALLFAAYRCSGTPLDRSPGADAAAAEVEQLDANPAFRGEIEGTGCAYMEIFRNVASRVASMKIFEARLRELGITAPEAFKTRIRECLDGGIQIQDKETD